MRIVSLRAGSSSATDYPSYRQNNQGYDLIAFFVSLHDIRADPVRKAS